MADKGTNFGDAKRLTAREIFESAAQLARAVQFTRKAQGPVRGQRSSWICPGRV